MQLKGILGDYLVKNKFVRAFACYNKDSKIRELSTSGGMFYLFASYIIEKYDGYVCGAVFDEKYNVIHKVVNEKKELEKLLGSKYPQSKIGEVYKEIKQLIVKNQVVLFCGTPCQVEGIIRYFGGKPENLWLIDFVCHGVASPIIWEEYLRKKTANNEIEGIVFKDKKYGWKHWHVHIKTNKEEYYEDGVTNLFMQSYLTKINIRPSCFECPFKGLDRYSDFTIADCWGIGEEDTELNDDRGLSALLVHSQRGLDVFDKLSEAICWKEYDAEVLMKKNWAAFTATERNADRNLFFLYRKKRGTSKAMKYFFGNTLIDRIHRKIIRLFYICGILGS